MRALFSLLLVSLTAAAASAATFPEIPASQRILSQQEVKNYWVNKMPTPAEPSRLARSYKTLIVNYHKQVGERHRLIQAIRAGKHDRLAKIVMLRHNIKAYTSMGKHAKAAALNNELIALETALAREAKERANADRLERLIAATERLAAAIENNGGVVPANAEQIVAEIVPFERDRNDRRDIIAHLHHEIALCRQPIIVHPRHGTNPHHHHTPGVSQRTSTRPRINKPITVRPSIGTAHRPSNPTRTTTVPHQPQVRQPQVRQVPAPRQPQIKPAK